VQTKIKGIIYLRAIIMNPFTNAEHIKELMEKIKSKAIPLFHK
jgi:hypothetical protein